ncbi:hypothetical protein PRK78_002850 [Emydomyces testavorans]|uniref:DUF866-domain-containing protein n=1 Tax=Emydomyces testavorans TaxID=2070801 RepID=A0AAF0DFP5_9EURO|nr:hypothetical protein PRK78_002850 [Emydomyces testavorans]
MYALTLSAVLAGVTDLQPTDTETSPYHYSFKVQCTSCREVHPKLEKHELHGSRGEANFVWKCGFCKRENSALVTTNPSAYTESQTQQAIIHFDCRGLDSVRLSAAWAKACWDEKYICTYMPPTIYIDANIVKCAADQGDWQCKGADSNTPFANIDLQEGEWYDYDEKAGAEVSVTGVKWEIKRA